MELWLHKQKNSQIFAEKKNKRFRRIAKRVRREQGTLLEKIIWTMLYII